MKCMKMSSRDRDAFLRVLQKNGQQYFRRMPWREISSSGEIDPYHVLVSEIMLQQTQVARVIPKFEAFLEAFPSLNTLAAASLGDVLQRWSGLGYNRRAKYLHEAAGQLQNAATPWTYEALVNRKGIGPNTAKAVLTYSYNQPHYFIETNIRTVYIHHFFEHQSDVVDAEIMEALQATLDRNNPRTFYWAVMDYGAQLKKRSHASRQSKGYVRQSAFVGSKRQVRGQVLRVLSAVPLERNELARHIDDKRLDEVLQDLRGEGLIKKDGNTYQLP